MPRYARCTSRRLVAAGSGEHDAAFLSVAAPGQGQLLAVFCSTNGTWCPPVISP
jgi:hypothetical protein